MKQLLRISVGIFILGLTLSFILVYFILFFVCDLKQCTLFNPVYICNIKYAVMSYLCSNYDKVYFWVKCFDIVLVLVVQKHIFFSNLYIVILFLTQGACLPVPGLTELPTCHICLERMDESVDGILTILCNHSFHGNCLDQWSDTTWVTRYSEFTTNGKSSTLNAGQTRLWWWQ